MVDDAFERVKVLANRFVVVTAFPVYRLLVRASEFKFEIVKTFRVPTFADAKGWMIFDEFMFEI